ncbi:isoflavone reductase family protein [Dendryphion nanum]|uniref:Isoflavone reductase family protein n=1 Tax=Dendryphion nanum TaxID=256645 RepID=A0A9P9E863_9PLEO|nr:isoflavone reductase family protein [Dendryphion nanum]
MSATHKVLLVGATGETGGDILDGLLADDGFEVSCLVQPSSANKPAVQELSSRNAKIVIVDLSSPTAEIGKAIKGFDTIISTIGFTALKAELSLVEAIAIAGTSRFVPCAFSTICPPGGIMRLRDDKETVFQQVWKHYIPYTIIDVGTWHQVTVPKIPSGKLDYAITFPLDEIFCDGEAKNLLMDKRDIGPFVANIVKDARTINQKVICYSDEISQNDVVRIVEEKSSEKLLLTHMSENEIIIRCDKARAVAREDPSDLMKKIHQSGPEYSVSKYVRRDNTLANAKYFGYLNARELYPDVKPKPYAEYVDEILQGKGKRPYADRF